MKEEHIVRRMLDVDMPGKRRRGQSNLRWEDERYDRGEAERGKHDEKGVMEEQDKQPYRRPHMTGQVRDEEGIKEDMLWVVVSQGLTALEFVDEH